MCPINSYLEKVVQIIAIVDKLLYNTVDAESLTYGQSSATISKFIFGIYPCQIK